MTPLRRLIHLFRSRSLREEGATLIIVAAVMTLLLPVLLAFAVETGEQVDLNRSLQSVANASAVTAARYINTVSTTSTSAEQNELQHQAMLAAQREVGNNGNNTVSIVANSTSANAVWPSIDLVVTPGNVPISGVTPGAFNAGGTPVDAVEVTAYTNLKHLFSFETTSGQLSRSAAAMVGVPSPLCGSPCDSTSAESEFSLGTSLAQVSTTSVPVLNTLLSALGVSANLSLVGYNGLVDSNITIQNLIDASDGVLTPQNVFSTTAPAVLSPAQWEYILNQAVSTQALAANCQFGATTPAICAAATSLGAISPSSIGTTSPPSCSLASSSLPTVTNVSPNLGNVTGGTSVTITGTNFSNVSNVFFGSTAVSSSQYTVNSTTSITATSPSNSAGVVDVTVSSVAGTSATSSADQFTYTASPTITSVDSSALEEPAGPTSGGTVNIFGSGFTGTTAVTFGGTAATNISIASDTQLTVTAPAHPAGTVSVSVTAAGGSATASNAYTYVAAPAITSVSPSSSPVAGANSGGSVTITGSGLTDTSSVTFGGVAGTSIDNVSDTEVIVTAPAHAAGAVSVVLTSAGGNTTDANAYNYPGPSISSISASGIPLTGTVTLTGVGLLGTSAVTFNGTAGTSISNTSDTQISVTAPTVTASTSVAIVVTSIYGTASYTYIYPTPTISSMSATTYNGNTTITGSNFSGNATITFTEGSSTYPVTGVALNSGSTLTSGSYTVAVPTGVTASTSIGVTVTTGYGTSASHTYTYPTPAITAASATTYEGNTTISGTGFSGNATVTFTEGSNTYPVTNVAPNSGSTLSAGSYTVTVPSGVTPSASIGVTVTTAYGTSSSYTYSYPTPTIAQITTAYNSSSGVATLTGTGYSGTATVTFTEGSNTYPVTNVAPNSGSTLASGSYSVTVPAGVTQSASIGVTVTTAYGTSTSYPYAYPTATITAMTATTYNANTTITGTGFSGNATVTFTEGSNVQTVSAALNSGSTLASGSYTVAVPTGVTASSGIGVTVTTASGTSPAFGYTYPTPTISAVSGAIYQGATTISGTGFSGNATVTFTEGSNTYPVTNVAPNSGSTLASGSYSVTVPSGVTPSNSVLVTVKTAYGTSSSFTYSYPTPSITSVSTVTYGGSAVISGTGFSGNATVTFTEGSNTYPVTNVSTNSGSTLSAGSYTVTVPSGVSASSVIGVTVTTAYGTSASYIYNYPTPSITSVSATTYGGSATISGTGFGSNATVTFTEGSNTYPVTNVAPNSGSTLSAGSYTVTMPAGVTPGTTIGVTITTGNGTSASYTYSYPTPTIASVSATTYGGSTTISGSGYSGTATVTFTEGSNTYPVTNVSPNSGGTLSSGSYTVTVPSGVTPSATIGVTVTTAYGTSASYTYSYPTPTIASVSATTYGGSTTISGSGYSGTATVTFTEGSNTYPVTNVSPNSGGTLSSGSYTVSVPSGVTPSATIGVTVTTAYGTSASYTYVYPTPTIAQITTAYGTSSAATITGTGYSGNATVTFTEGSNTYPVTNVSPNSGGTLSSGSYTVSVPSGVTPSATIGVTVTTAYGTSTSYTYVYPSPTITAVSVTTYNGSTTITGTGFAGSATVTFTEGSNVHTASASLNSGSTLASGSYTVAVPTGVTASATIGVTVTTPYATSPSYTYVYPTPTISSVSSTTAGGTATITGTGYSGAASVTFIEAGVSYPGTSVALTSGSTLSSGSYTVVVPATLPASSSGISVTVATSYGTSAAFSPYPYPNPTISGISTEFGSGQGPYNQPTAVTITGSNLYTSTAGSTTVNFGISPALPGGADTVTVTSGEVGTSGSNQTLTIPAPAIPSSDLTGSTGLGNLGSPSDTVTVTLTTSDGSSTTSYTYETPSISSVQTSGSGSNEVMTVTGYDTYFTGDNAGTAHGSATSVVVGGTVLGLPVSTTINSSSFNTPITDTSISFKVSAISGLLSLLAGTLTGTKVYAPDGDNSPSSSPYYTSNSLTTLLGFDTKIGGSNERFSLVGDDRRTGGHSGHHRTALDAPTHIGETHTSVLSVDHIHLLPTSILGHASSQSSQNAMGPFRLASFDQSLSANECVTFCQLLSVDGSTCASTAPGQAALAAEFNVFQTLLTDAELSNGQNGLDISSALNLAGVTASLTADVISPPRVYYGPPGGTPLTDSQVNVDLKLSIPLGGLSVATVNIPISGASGTATLESVNCNASNALTSATISASTNTATNSVTLSLLGGPATPISTVTVSGAPQTTLTFTSPSTQSISATGSAISFSSVPVLDDLTGVIGDTLSALSGTLVPILASLGVSIGTADVGYLFTACSPVTPIATS